MVGLPHGTGNHAVGFVAFTLLSLVGLGITCVVVYVLHDLGHANELVAKIAAVGLAFTWNFLSRKFLLFKPQAPADAEEELKPGATVSRRRADSYAAPDGVKDRWRREKKCRAHPSDS